MDNILRHKKIKVGKKCIEAFRLRLLSKNLIVLRGSKGYIMCGYLNLKAAQRARDAAVKITGVSTIEEAVKTTVHSYTSQARRLGVCVGQPIKEVLRLIA